VPSVAKKVKIGQAVPDESLRNENLKQELI